ncbi:hypothetical protein B7463_g211, partial [Scytalidium lignicola]
MGRLESLTTWALGRSPFEDELIETSENGNHSNRSQKYDEHGHPTNPNTRRREREQVRAANEVMQVTGVVEDGAAVKARMKAMVYEKNQETVTGFRFMEAGRAMLVVGVWGVLGFRRRILLYRSHATMGFLELVKHEASLSSIPRLIFAGIPTVLAYHVSDWACFIMYSLMDENFEDNRLTPRQARLKRFSQRLLDIAFCYITLHFRMYAMLQQLHLIPASQYLPGLRSFIPFTSSSPLQLPQPLSWNFQSLLSWSGSLFQTFTPLLVIFMHGKTKFFVARLLYGPVYKSLPRPVGESMFSGLPFSSPAGEYDSPDRERPNPPTRTEDEQTLRALEGLPPSTPVETGEPHGRIADLETDSTFDEDGEITHTTLISFDVEATESIETSLGTWSAELRSANEPKPMNGTQYRITGLTMLSPILAAEGFREILASMVVLPLEAAMVRVVGKAFKGRSGMGSHNFYVLGEGIHGLGNLFAAFAVQLIVTGAVWTGMTVATQWMIKRKKEKEKGDTWR